jgi:energy-converting hydrogenase Eha subunit H
MKVAMRIVCFLLAACALCFAALFGWTFYQRCWRWRDCFNELGRCYDPIDQTVMTDAGFVWGLMAVVALGLALALWMLGRRR